MVHRGDWNVVRFPFERSGCNLMTSEMFAFSDWINQHALDDLQLEGLSSPGTITKFILPF